MSLRVAAVGAGYFSQFHQRGWRAIAGAQCVALAEKDAARGRASAAQHAVPEVYDDVETMLDAVRPDLLDVITPPPTHRAIVGAALARRIPVICQKAFGRDYTEARAMAADARAAGVPVVVHENVRWSPWNREAKRFIESGRLGTPHGIAFRLRPGDGQGPQAYLDRQPYFQTMPRLLVVETAIHWIDTFRFLLGEMAAVSARLRRINPAIAGEDAGLILFEFAGGATGLFDGNRLNDHVATNPRRTMGECWLEGSGGVLRLDGEARLWWKPHHGPEVEHAYDRGPEDSFGGGACEALQRHVVSHLENGSALENTAQDYLTNLRVQEAVYASHLSGQRIVLDGFEPATP